MTRVPDFEVDVSPGEFGLAGGGPVTGPIWTRVAGTDFPESGWPDFPVALLGGWLTTLSELEHGDPQPAVLHFMEGPYGLEVVRSGAVWSLRALENDDDLITETTVDSLDEILAPVRQAASRTLAACREHGWNSSDMRYLAWFTGT